MLFHPPYVVSKDFFKGKRGKNKFYIPIMQHQGLLNRNISIDCYHLSYRTSYISWQQAVIPEGDSPVRKCLGCKEPGLAICSNPHPTAALRLPRTVCTVDTAAATLAETWAQHLSVLMFSYYFVRLPTFSWQTWANLSKIWIEVHGIKKRQQISS